MSKDKLKQLYEFSPKAISNWFQENRQPYFFRFSRTPYRVWITEVLLQQTRINYALPKLKNFLRRFPDLDSLAKAKQEDVLSAFQGLGYYNRAINLHSGAQFIQNKFKGVLPKKYHDLLLIPSIGNYTASAIASICFQEKKPAIDGNIKRIFSRLCLVEENISSKEFQKKCEDYFNDIFQNMKEDPGLLNEALMELGQIKCTVRNPQCISCPLNKSCAGFLNSNQTKYPRKTKGLKKKETIWLLFLIQWNNQLLLQKDNTSYFLKNQWSLPSIVYFPEEQKKILSYHKTFPKIITNEFENRINLLSKGEMHTKCPPIRHTITNHKIHIYTENIEMDQTKPQAFALKKSDNIRWCSVDNLKMELPSRAILKALSLT